MFFPNSLRKNKIKAFNDKYITADQYKLAKNTVNSLILEIKQNKNIINFNIKELLRNI